MVNNKKGSTLMECAICLIVIAAISIAAITSIRFTLTNSVKIEAKYRAIQMTENVVEGFYGTAYGTAEESDPAEAFYTFLKDDLGMTELYKGSQYTYVLLESPKVEVNVTVNGDATILTVSVSGVNGVHGGPYYR